MNPYKSRASGISYYRMRKDEATPDGWARFTVRVTDRETHEHLHTHFIAAKSEEHAQKVVSEDYQTRGDGFIVRPLPRGG